MGIPLFGLGLQNIFSAPCISPMGLGKIFTITQLGTWKNSTISSHMYISKEKEKLTTRYNTSPETLLPPAHRCRCLHHRCRRRRRRCHSSSSNNSNRQTDRQTD